MSDPRDEHPLKTETRGLPRWVRRWWWVVWAVLLAQSNLWQYVGARTADRYPDQPVYLSPGPGGLWRLDSMITRPEHGDAVPHSSSIVSSLVKPEAIVIERAYRDVAGELHGMPALGQWLDNGRDIAVFLHGSPGKADDFAEVWERLSHENRRVISVDLPGFGRSDPWPSGYSIRSHAEAVIAFLDRLGLHRFHLIGWSMGGGVALNVIDLLGEKAQNRVASLTLMASIGVQEGEGSGNYSFEHFKYGVGFIGLVVAPELVPHFGLLGDRRDRYSFIRNFWDTDQRPLRGIMERVNVPTLILHGNHDMLVPSWVAEEGHRLIPTSRLVMLDANHFLPFMQAEESATILEEHFARHDKPGVEARTDTINLAPIEPPHTPLTRLLSWTGPVLRATPWWAELVVIAALTLVFPVLTSVLAALLCAHQQLDLFEAITGVAAGWIAQAGGTWALARALGERVYAHPGFGKRMPRVSASDWARRLDTRPFRSGWQDHFVPSRRLRGPLALGLLKRAGVLFRAGRVAAVLTSSVLLLLTPYLIFVLGNSDPATQIGHNLGTEVRVVVIALLITWFLAHSLSRPGREFMRARIVRLIRHEYWPAWLFYAPLYAYLVPLSLKHRGLMTPSCCNPGIENGGGLIGESKHSIMHALVNGAPPHLRDTVLPTHLIAADTDPAQRARDLERLMAEHALACPVILKPDEGQRGYAVRLIRSAVEALRYLTAMKRAAVLQPYHPGPEECGILWARRVPDASTRKASAADDHARTGFIFSITRKNFPIITGDGRHTLEELIDAHPRYRCQASVYLERFASDASRILAAGEQMRLAVSGNHCQGTLFRDGADLITPALEDAIDAIASRYPMPDGSPGGLDFGRFDVRYTSDDDLKAGRGLAIVELNGTFSESTNLYDPSKSLVWSYSVLFRQWRVLYELGAARRAAGVTPMRAAELLRHTFAHFGARDGPAIAD